MSLGTLTIDLAANVAGLQSDLGKAQRLFDTNARNFERTVASTVKVAAGLTAGVVVGFSAMLKSSIDSADALSKQSSITGMAIEQLSGLKHAADLGGVGFDQLTAGLNKYSKVVADAFDGTGAGAATFQRLGISVKNSAGDLKSNYDLLGEVADRFAELEDGAAKTALAQELFGRSGAALIPVLNAGASGLRDAHSEAERLGLVFSAKTGKAAEEFNDNLSRLKLSLVGVSNTVAADVTPALAEMTAIFADPNVQQGIASIAKGIVDIGTAAVSSLASLGNFTKWLAEELAATIHGPAADDIVRLEDRLAELELRKKNNRRGAGEALNKEIEGIKELIKNYYEYQAALANKPKEQESSVVDAGKKKSGDVLGVDPDYAKKIAAIEDAMAAELTAALEKERRIMEANEREISSQRDKFARIHEERLAAEEKVVDLENFRAERAAMQLDAEMEALRKKLGDSELLQREYEKAREDQKAAHTARLKQIEERAAEEERKKKEEGYRNLIGLAETYNNAKGQAANRYTAVALNALRIISSKERLESIKSVTRDGVVAVQKAWASAAFPANMPAVVLAGGAAAANMATVTGIAHGGLDYVPKESTYLLDKGERVLSPNQNKDLTNFMANGGVATVNVYNYGSEKVSVTQADGTIDIVVGRAVEKINDQILRGNGVATTMQRVYGLQRRGS